MRADDQQYWRAQHAGMFGVEQCRASFGVLAGEDFRAVRGKSSLRRLVEDLDAPGFDAPMIWHAQAGPEDDFEILRCRTRLG
jgi:hypothetical protein